MKKVVAVLLAVTLAVLPALSLAAPSPLTWVLEALAAGKAIHAESSMAAGELPLDESIAKVVSEIVGSISTKVDAQSGQTSFTLLMSGNEAITFTEAVDGNTIYLQSNLLGDDVIAVSPDEFGELAVKALNWAENSNLIDKESAEQIREMLSQGSVAVSLEGAMDLSDLDITPLLTWASELSSSMTMVDASEAPEGADDALLGIEFRLTKEQYKGFVDALGQVMLSSSSIVNMLDSIIASQGIQDATAEDLVKAAVEQLNTSFDAMQEDLVIRAFLNASQEVVAATMSITTDDGTGAATVNGEYTRHVEANSETHNVVLNVTQNGDTQTITITRFASEALSTLTIEMAGMKVTATLNKDRVYNVSADDQATLVVEQDGNQLLTVAAQIAALRGEDGSVTMDILEALYFGGTQLLTETTSMVTTDPLPGINTGSALHIAQLGDEAFGEWMTTAFQSLLTGLMGLAQYLPADLMPQQ